LLVEHLGRERGFEFNILRERRKTFDCRSVRELHQRRQAGGNFTNRLERGDLDGFDLFYIVECLSLDFFENFEIGHALAKYTNQMLCASSGFGRIRGRSAQVTINNLSLGLLLRLSFMMDEERRC
jgi:hypothetical protein